MTSTQLPTTTHTGARLVATDGRDLPLRSTDLTVTAGAGLARTRLVQRFHNPHAEPLTVDYLLPLPADGTVAAFAFVLGERRIQGVIEGRSAARERFERALAEGRSGALLEQERSALFAQTIGNLPPGAEVVVEIEVDQPLLWCRDGEWEYRFPTTVAPRYLGGAGRVPDAGRVTVDVGTTALAPRLTLALAIGDGLRAPPTSPSHALLHDGDRVALPREGVPLDRDLVVRWRTAGPEVGIALVTARPSAGTAHGDVGYGLLSLVPPRDGGPVLARDLTVLLDTSGSMQGEPLAQAKAVVRALLAGLTERDQLQMVEFSDRARRWQRRPTVMTARGKKLALAWLDGLVASGGTEMVTGVRESLRSLRAEAQGQVLLVTDGLVGFEREIVQALVASLPDSCRFHVLGVGSASNRSLSHAVARAGRGVEAIVALGEAPTRAAERLDAAMRAPVVVELVLAGSALLDAAPARLPDLFAGEPARISLRLRPEGGTLLVRGRGADGPFVQRIEVAPIGSGSGRPEVVTRCGRELVDDLELAAVRGDADVDARIEALGLSFGFATRCTSWVAIGDEVVVDPTAATRRERMPHELAYGLSAEGVGLRAPAEAWGAVATGMLSRLMPPAPKAQPGGAARSRKAREQATPELRDDELAAPARQQPQLPFVAGSWLRGPAVLRWRTGGELALELVVAGGAWQLPEAVELRWADGTTCSVSIDISRSTGSALLGDGTVVRLVLRLPEGVPAAAPGEVRLDGVPFEVLAA
ncbi:MAG: VWA domain-containing protein [Planctomycetes bacterium]|nr:VWA domain-containing protein [Planctomycetota bacterium]